MSASLRTGPFLRRIAMAAGCIAALAAPAAASAAGPEKPSHEIRDPHYGDTLFHFFQDHYFTSITSLMVSQKQERIEHHADEAEVLRGGMLLSYGMPRPGSPARMRAMPRLKRT